MAQHAWLPMHLCALGVPQLSVCFCGRTCDLRRVSGRPSTFRSARRVPCAVGVWQQAGHDVGGVSFCASGCCAALPALMLLRLKLTAHADVAETPICGECNTCFDCHDECLGLGGLADMGHGSPCCVLMSPCAETGHGSDMHVVLCMSLCV